MAVDLYAACFPGAILFMLKSGKGYNICNPSIAALSNQ
ncbi:hypothetical protein M099_1722 [Phocaeicola vulgatus str. 3975 RP4]|uniref:Uncharacterized protein n=2 Tax=Phocaeicola vulgatus TaxID=821 RepID=A0A078QXL4_PHOVU|nr:hypothetical protein M097_4218 [Phocaeicola vulgatus str. 3775 SL(B) 10 (iv)]KDS38854.1 hypothetical protein M098_3814 [Phocaeicola vulgatus str. 3775 SR(B) 19]KDS54624.1 hypothetical protein M099_1722 [Phocaeicola vulgatus str. 3975 RP4]